MTEQPSAPPSATGAKDAPKGTAPESPQERAAKLRAQLAEAEAALPPEPGTVRLKVMPPHDSFTVAGFTVGKDPTLVPSAAVSRITGAAAEVGVTIKEA